MRIRSGSGNAANEAMNDHAAQQLDTEPAPSGQPAGLCLVVHDEAELRTRLAGLVRRTAMTVSTVTATTAELAALPTEQLRGYAAVFLILEFTRRRGDRIGEPLAIVSRLRARAPAVAIFIFARHGDERWAVRAIKAGAADYWPIHSIDVPELASALLPILAPPRNAGGQRAAPAASTPAVAGYRILKKLAHSSAATVYLARSEDLGRSVALKVQPIKGHASDSDRQRFTRECEILSRLNHRSVADLIDYGITPDHLYLALEYFPCGSMRERLKHPVSEADARNYARQIAEALQVVHGAGILHRDVKPSNLMLTTDNHVVLIDFGSARAQLVARDSGRSTQTTATPYYVCPEQLDGRDPDQRADLYSLGIIFYEMLAGDLPYRAHDLAELFELHRTAPIPWLPVALSRYQPLINRLLAKNPDDRYASAAHFLDALNTFAD